MDIIISIHPEHVEKILDGTKKFEFRKVLPKREIENLVIYCTAPIQKIVGVAAVKRVITGTPSQVWRKTSSGAGIPKEFFQEYFKCHSMAVAFELVIFERYKYPVSFRNIASLRSPPQSFAYISNEETKLLIQYGSTSHS